MNGLTTLFMAGGAALIVVFTIIWLVQLRTGNAAIVDTVWSASFPMLALIYLFLSPGYPPRQWLVMGVVAVWGFRLAFHLLLRTLGHPEDVRYAALRKEWGERQNFLMLRFFYFQAILALVLSYPFAVMMVSSEPPIILTEIIGSVIWLIAVIGESTADAQLKKFKSHPGNKGKICNTGLWYYSRHPNYFFEWLTWVGFFIMALGSPWGFISIFCPVLMFFFLTRVTGIEYTEAQMIKSRGQAFLDYRKTTSAFFPLPKRKLN